MRKFEDFRKIQIETYNGTTRTLETGYILPQPPKQNNQALVFLMASRLIDDTVPPIINVSRLTSINTIILELHFIY